MAVSVTRGYTFGATETVTNTKLHSLVDSAAVTGITLDIAYDGGNSITVDANPVTLNLSHATNIGLDINKTAGVGDAVEIDVDVANAIGLNIDHAAAATGDAIQIDYAADGVLLDLNKTGAGAGNVIDIANAGTGYGLAIASTNNAAHINLSGDPTVASPVDGDLWFTGSALNFRNGAATVDLLNLSPFLTGDWIISSVVTAHSGWTNVSATYSNKFMRINATPLTTGGADTHTHGAGSYVGSSHTHTYSGTTSGGSSSHGCQGGGDSVSPSAHTHTYSGTTAAGGAGAITGTSASANNIPAYVQVVIFQKD